MSIYYDSWEDGYICINISIDRVLVFNWGGYDTTDIDFGTLFTDKPTGDLKVWLKERAKHFIEHDPVLYD